MQVSQQVHSIYTEARDIARSAGKTFTTAQLLLAMFTDEAAPNQARTVLVELGIDEDEILASLAVLSPEPGATMEAIQQRTQMIAASCESKLVNSLHLLLAITQTSSSLAYRILENAGVNIGTLRVQLFSYVTGLVPRRLIADARQFEAERAALETSFDWGRFDELERRTAPTLRGVVDDDIEDDEDEEASDASARPRRGAFADESDRAEAAAKAIQSLVERVRAATPRPKPVATPAAVEPAQPSVDVDTSVFILDPETYPTLTSLARNLTLEAAEGRLDPLIGRRDELEQVLDILHKRRANNPCLVGEPGVGKTALVEGLAQALVEEAARTGEPRILLELNVGGLVAGTQLRGALSERMGQLRAEVAAAGRKVIVFIDEIHTIVGAGSTGGAMDAANELKAALARGDFPCIGATTVKEYRQHIEEDPALERRFQAIMVEEPSPEEATSILTGALPRYAAHHGVTFTSTAVESSVRLGARYIPDRRLPDKALNLVDLAGARAARAGEAQVDHEDIARVVSKIAGIPLERLLVSDAERLLGMEEFLREHIIGQSSALARIAAMIQRNSAGFRSRRPIGSMLLLGPTGVGKTETVRVLADFLFQDRDAMTRLDMSEFSEAHAVAKLLGAGPGYVGHERGGQLTDAVQRRPYQIVLFDEVEKAHPEVLNILLQVLEEGALRDGRGRRVSFSNTLVALTSNLGAGEVSKRGGGIGFANQSVDGGAKANDEDSAAVLKAASRALTPELWNRIEEKLVFHPLTRDEVGAIARLLLRDSSERLAAETGIRYDVDEDVIAFLVANGGYEAAYGARPMRRTIQRHVEGLLSRAILSGQIPQGARVSLGVTDGALVLRSVSSVED